MIIIIKQKHNQSNSITNRRKFSSYSPGIRTVSKDGINKIEKNMNFPIQNNYPLVVHNNIKNNKINNDEDKLIKNTMSNASNMKSFEFYLPPNTLKKKNFIVEKKNNNDINNKNKNKKNNNTLLTNNFNMTKTTKNNISKKTFSNLKGSNYLNNIFSDNSKPILINTSHIRKTTQTTKNNNYKKNTNSKSTSKSKNKNNNKTRSVSNKNSKSKSKNKNNILLHKKNYNKNNIDKNIIINFNILKPNIILDHQKATTSRKIKSNKLSLNQNILGSHNNNMPSKNERPITEGNNCPTVRNHILNKNCKNKNK